MCLAFIAAYFALAAEIRRRKLPLDPYSVVAYVAIAGIVGAKIWHIIDTPADRNFEFVSNAQGFLNTLLAVFYWFRGGFAWFGGFVAGIATLLVLARRYKVRILTMLDLCSSAPAVG